MLREGDWVSIDGTTGEVFAGRAGDRLPDFDDPHLLELLALGGRLPPARRLGQRRLSARRRARARATAPRASASAAPSTCSSRPSGCRSCRRMILAQDDDGARRACWPSCCRCSARTSTGLFRAMDGLPVTIRLIDPPLHEFLPSHDELLQRGHRARDARCELHVGERDRLDARARRASARCSRRSSALRESNPMLGLRGVRLGHPHAGAGAHAGAGDLRGGLRLRRGGHRGQPEDHDPARRPLQRARGASSGLLEAEARKVMAEQEREGALPVRHDDRDPARGAHRGPDRRVRASSSPSAPTT